MIGVDCDSMLVFDLRDFAREYAGTVLGHRIRTAANELDRLHELERVYTAALQKIVDMTPDGTHPLDGQLAPRMTEIGIIARKALPPSNLGKKDR